MKILVSNAYETSNDSFSEIVSHLKKLGHNVIEDKIQKATSESSKHNYLTELDQTIKNIDVLILDITNPDTKTGYIIAHAISEKKIVIALENEGKSQSSDGFIHNNTSKNLIIKTYTAKSIIDVVNQSLEDAKNKLDTKFILIISPEIDRYLEWAGQNKRMHKAQIVRNAIENTIKRDKEYKDYLEGSL